MNVGLIGCGGIANAHMEVLGRIKNARVAAVCDLNLKRAKDIARRFNVKKTYTDYNELLSDEKLDLVDICTPVSTHAHIACDVAKVVSAIFLEKPMAINLHECDEIVQTMKKYGTKLCVGHNQIFYSSIQKAKTLVDSGKYELLSFKTSLKENFELLKSYKLLADWMVSPSQRGIIWESCTHLAYLQLHFLPDIEEVYAVGGKTKYPVFDNFAVLLRTSNDRFGQIELSWLPRETEIVYEIVDSKGKRLKIFRDFDFLHENSALPPLTPRGVISSFFADESLVLRKWLRFGSNYIHHKRIMPHFKLMSSFISSVQNNLPSPITPEEGRNTINLLECIEKSLIEGQPIRVRTPTNA
jgi:UDP-N-acetylglucosamine 3-dehydrogenase